MRHEKQWKRVCNKRQCHEDVTMSDDDPSQDAK
jgi:hypothetical protein